MIYSRGNAAKEWILQDLNRSIGNGPVRILDLACGRGWIWKSFLAEHVNVSVVGVDTDAEAIQRGNAENAGITRFELRTFDAQQSMNDSGFEFALALSALEHVVDHAAFLKTVWESLKPNGVAYLNYDAGHFRSRNIKERIMVPVSQLLAMIGYEEPYMKKVDDAEFQTLCTAQGFQILNTHKHNLHPLKGFMKGASDEAIAAWCEFEDKLNRMYSPDELDRVMWSTTVICKKP